MSVIFGRRLPAVIRTYNGFYAKISRIRTRVDACVTCQIRQQLRFDFDVFLTRTTEKDQSQ